MDLQFAICFLQGDINVPFFYRILIWGNQLIAPAASRLLSLPGSMLLLCVCRDILEIP